MQHTYLFSVLTLILLAGCKDLKTTQSSPPNVLFIAIDDLRPELGCYGQSIVHSPNIDRLASAGLVFNNHFVTVPTCGASRYGLLTGMLPRDQGQLRNNAIVNHISNKPETDRPESFVHHLRRNGYYTVGIGKISHSADGLVYGYLDDPSDQKEMPHSWDEFLFNAGEWGNGWNAFFGYAGGGDRNHLDKQVKPYESADVGDEGYPDGLTTNLVLEQLKTLSAGEKPFFLGVGFFKPHLPFNAPKKYWDLYDQQEIPISESPQIPENTSRASLHGSGEFNQYALGEEKADLEHNISDDYSRKIRHGYYAAISYIDAQVGKIMDELENLGLAESTTVVIWGDHGWHLGDHRVWGKHTIFEHALRSALIIKPAGSGHVPKKIEAVVSTVDLYPTIIQMCGLDMPYQGDGQSLTSMFTDGNPSWRNTAFSYFRNGISMRNEQYRLSKYFREDSPTVELFDHLADPFETQNIAGKNPEIVENLLVEWEKGNTGLYIN